MENDRSTKATESLKFWQERLNLQDWDLSIELTNFERDDYIQTGDFRVDSDKKATILISEKQTDKDLHSVVLHEIVHILLWRLDNFCETKIDIENKKEYMSLLENTVDLLTKRFEN